MINLENGRYFYQLLNTYKIDIFNINKIKIMKFTMIVLGLLLGKISQSCMVRRIDGTSIYYCDAVTYPCVTGTCITIPLERGMVSCQCKAYLTVDS